MKTEASNDLKRSNVPVDPVLNQYRDQVLFPKKEAMVNRAILERGLPASFIGDSSNSDQATQKPFALDQKVMGGRPVFAGTEIPIIQLFTTLAAGHTKAQFLAKHPNVDAKQVELAMQFFQYRSAA